MARARYAEITRKTRETEVRVRLHLDGSGKAGMRTGVGFLDHMLTLLARHGKLDLTVKARGDREVDDHHLVEDVGLTLGEALRRALGDKRALRRFGEASAPMDEAMVRVALDLSGRSYLSIRGRFPRRKTDQFDPAHIREFLRALSTEGAFNLHVEMVAGENTHHVLEALFKALALALREAAERDPREQGLPTTKGKL